MSFDVLILNIVLILSKKSFLKDLNCYEKITVEKIFLFKLMILCYDIKNKKRIV